MIRYISKEKQLERALDLAYRFHIDQVDKAGKPYVLHPLFLALSEDIKTTEGKIVCLLHDIVEDTPLTLSALKKEGFSSDIIEAIKLLTRDKDISYFEYIKQIKESGNKLAINCKIADLKHNSDLSRIDNYTKRDQGRVSRYKKALKLLNEPVVTYVQI